MRCVCALFVQYPNLTLSSAGWGSLSLYLAQKYPKSRIVGLSNSSTQKLHIDSIAKGRGLTNLEVCSY